MKILFLTHAFNSLTQRLFVELTRRGDVVSVEFDINDRVTLEAVDLFRPDVILAPFLKRRIPAEVWRNTLCLVVHPGIVGDRGPSALDWAILEGRREWGVTVIEAVEEFDAGPVWASASFRMDHRRKSSLYRNEVTECAVQAVFEALTRVASGIGPTSRSPSSGVMKPLMKQGDRRIDWLGDSTETVLRKIYASDGFPGVLDELFGRPVYLYNACADDRLRGEFGKVIARRDEAICRATVDGAVWIASVKEKIEGRLASETPALGAPETLTRPTFKLPASLVFQDDLRDVPEIPIGIHDAAVVSDSDPAPQVPVGGRTYRQILYEENGPVGYLHFDFYNGAMSAGRCRRLRDAIRYAKRRPTKVLVLMGGPDFWSNGIDLNTIESADSPADASMENIVAMNEVCREVIECRDILTVTAMQGNAAAGGVFFGLASDYVYARSGVILNPHYKNMGNLYGSEFWTYLLPRRIGRSAIMDNRLPIGAPEAKTLGLIDDFFGNGVPAFCREIRRRAETLARRQDIDEMIRRKAQRLDESTRHKPLDAWESEELEHMRLNFFGFDPSYHVARYHFVTKRPESRTPLHLARHRILSRQNPARVATPSDPDGLT